MALERNDWPATARGQQKLIDRRFKLIVVGDDDPGRVVRGFNEFRRHWIAWGPQLHWAVVNGIAAAQNLGARISGVTIRTRRFQHTCTACFIIAMKYMRRAFAQDSINVYFAQPIKHCDRISI